MSSLILCVILNVFVFVLETKSSSIRCGGQEISAILTIVSQWTKTSSKDSSHSSSANLAMSQAIVCRSDAAFKVPGDSLILVTRLLKVG
ncbi:MAG: hypothetical protein NXY57DRAFT_992187 [Lentinula lateritia]|nr:MAG: hypothetical protein NXY57DRAFT_992187 [Lentinula lateritia]